MGAGAPEVRRRKEEALAGLFEAQYERIVRYVSLRIGRGADAEDLASQVFLKAVESLDSYEERGVPMQAWLYRIAHNLSVDYLRRNSHRQAVTLEDQPVADPRGSDEVAALRIELEAVAAGMGQLTQAQRDVLALRVLGGLTSEQTGKVLGKSSGAVREMQSSALKSLRRIVGEEGRKSRG